MFEILQNSVITVLCPPSIAVLCVVLWVGENRYSRISAGAESEMEDFRVASCPSNYNPRGLCTPIRSDAALRHKIYTGKCLYYLV